MFGKTLTRRQFYWLTYATLVVKWIVVNIVISMLGTLIFPNNEVGYWIFYFAFFLAGYIFWFLPHINTLARWYHEG